jgi:SAM-dependent methyltransferase
MDPMEIAMQGRCPTGAAGGVVAAMMGAANADDYALALEALDARAGDRLLEIGMGAGAHVPELLRAGIQYFGIDHSLDMVRIARANAPDAWFQCSDICDPAVLFPCVDRVLAVNTMQWWADATAALDNIRASLMGGSRLVIGVAAPPPRYAFAGFPWRHRTDEEIEALLNDSGFENVDVRRVLTDRRPYRIAVAEVR